MSQNPLHRLMNPRSIATVGAGNNLMKMGTMHALSIINDGYQGTIYPVHPHEKKVLGIDAYPSIADIPGVPDLAFIVVPSSEVVKLIEEFGKKGTKSAIIITAGFGEMNEEGRRMQERLNGLSDQYGIRFLGPNCMGIINSEISLNTTVMPYTAAPGSLGFASQSGTYVTQPIPYLGQKGIRFSKAISVGNSANINIIDALEYLGEDEQTRAISLYIEGISDVPRFIEVARAITPRKPVLAQYVGGSSAGARSSMSHTGSMAAPDHLYDGMFRQAGVIRVQSVEDLYHYGNMLASQPPLKGKRIGILTNSGGPGSAMANALEKGGLEVPEYSPALQEQLRPLVPPHAPCGNPLDMTFSMDIDALSIRIPDIILKSGEVDGLVVHGVMGTGWLKAVFPHYNAAIQNITLETMLAGFQDKSPDSAERMQAHNKPVCVSSFYDRGDNYTLAYHEHGVPVFDSPEKTAGGMIMMMRHMEVRDRKPLRKPAPVPASSAAARLLEECRAKGRANLDEHGSKLFLKEWCIPVTEEIVALTEDEAAAAAEKAGYPLVMKASAADILHKTGKGLIYLNLKSKDEAVAAFRKIQEAAGRNVPVIAYRMVRGEREFVAGLVSASGFVPSVMFGLGGIFTEALNDAVFRPAPLSEEDAAEMLHDIRSRGLLGSYRGMPAVNTGALARMLHLLSLVPFAHPEVAEIDINPIIIEGAEPVAVDALVVLKSPLSPEGGTSQRAD